MSKLLRGFAAAYGAKKVSGCGCLGMLLAFLILWAVLGQFGIFQ